MTQKEKMELLNGYIQANVAPILVEGIPTSIFKDEATILPATCALSELNGHYEGIDFVPPIWYQEVLFKENDPINLLVIDNLGGLSKADQMKFYELLCYRKIGVFELPANCVILLTTETMKLHETIYSLVAHIGDVL